MKHRTKPYQLEVFHSQEGLLIVFQCNTLDEAYILLQDMVKQTASEEYYLHILDQHKNRLAYWPEAG